LAFRFEVRIKQLKAIDALYCNIICLSAFQ